MTVAILQIMTETIWSGINVLLWKEFHCVKPLSSDRYGGSFKCVNILMLDILRISGEITGMWIPQDFTDDESILL